MKMISSMMFHIIHDFYRRCRQATLSFFTVTTAAAAFTVTSEGRVCIIREGVLVPVLVRRRRHGGTTTTTTIFSTGIIIADVGAAVVTDMIHCTG